jgi:hypothetical protein
MKPSAHAIPVRNLLPAIANTNMTVRRTFDAETKTATMKAVF